jgi:hypothetical protein
MARIPPLSLVRFISVTLLTSIVTTTGWAETVITAPGDFVVTGHGPEPDELMNHYALENSTPFQFRIATGVCSGSTNLCVGGADDGDACATNADCTSGPLNFLSGQTEMFDADGNSIAGPFPFTDVDFEAGASLQNIGICNVDPTTTCSDPGGKTKTPAGRAARFATPLPGYVPDPPACWCATKGKSSTQPGASGS